MEYKSPIEIATKSYMTQVDDEILRAVHKVGIYVDKEELLRALKYDRDQFNIGFNAGYEQARKETAREILQAWYDDAKGAGLGGLTLTYIKNYGKRVYGGEVEE